MRVCSGRALAAWTLVCASIPATVALSEAQVSTRDVPVVRQPQQRFNAGQDIQPIFEGWTRSEDGSYQFHFGYLNRNYQEQPHVPVGETNFFSPGPDDRGQPAYFYPRTQRYQFEVPVPASFGPSDELTWTVTHNGSTQVAIGWLQAEWEVDVNTITSNTRMGNGRPVDQLFANGRASVTVEAGAASVAVGQPLTLTAVLIDDELPTELPPRNTSNRRRLPALTPPEDAPDIPDNVEWYAKPRAPRNGLAVMWLVYRGPADAVFEPAGFQRSVAEEEEAPAPNRIPSGPPPGPETTHLDGDGWTSSTFESTVTFDEPGEYTLRAFASDSMLLTTADVTVTVR